MPEKCQKPDTAHNDDRLEEAIDKCMSSEKRLYPLRINKNTVLYVTRNKCNEKYRQEYLQRMEGTKPKAHPYTGGISIDKEALQAAISAGLTQTRLAKKFGVSTTTIRNKLKEHGLL